MEVDQSQAKDERSVPTRSRGRSLAVAALIFATLLAGCGVPGEPLPPLLEIPAPITDLAATQVGARLRLSWSAPLLTTEGTRARRLDRVELYGAFLPSATPLASFTEQARLLATVTATAPLTEQTRSVQEIPLELSQIGQQASFAVKAVNDRGKDAGFSNIVSLEIANVPAPPSGLEALLTETAIRLRWRAAEQSAFGGPAPPPDGYQVYRAEARTPDAAEMIGTTQSPSFEDTSFAWERRYVYFVRAVVQKGETAAATPQSAPVEVAALDRFPPAPPRNVRAIAVPGAVELSWSPNTEPDLAGYNIYRSAGDSLRKLNPELLPLPLFRDTTVTPAAPYTYQVGAADKNGNESPPSEEIALTAE